MSEELTIFESLEGLEDESNDKGVTRVTCGARNGISARARQVLPTGLAMQGMESHQ